MCIGTPFVADAQAPELIQPGECPFYNPPPSAQSTAVFRVAHRKQGYDVPGTQTLPDRFRVITPVA